MCAAECIVCQVDMVSGSIALMSQSTSSAMHTHMYGSIRRMHEPTATDHREQHLTDESSPSLMKKLGLLDQLATADQMIKSQHSIASLAAGPFDTSTMGLDPAALDSSFHLAAVPRAGTLCVPATIKAYYAGAKKTRPLWTGCAYRPDGQAALSSNWMGSAEGQSLGDVQELLAKPLQSATRQDENATAETDILYQTISQASHPFSTPAQTDLAVMQLHSGQNLATAALHAIAIAQQAQRTGQQQLFSKLIAESNLMGGTSSPCGAMLTALLKSAGLESHGFGGTVSSSHFLPQFATCSSQVQLSVRHGKHQHVPLDESISTATIFTPRLVRSQAAARSGPFQLLPQPRGALQNLCPVPLTAKPQPGMVWVETQAVGVNFRDVLNVLGMYPGDPGPPGADCAGVVKATGPGVTDLQPGMAVFGLAPGCLGSHVHADASCLVPKPAHVTHAAAATIPTVYITAHTAFRQATAVQPGCRVLVHAAAGGVGLAAVQVLAEAQAEVFATAGGPSKRALLRQLGLRHVADSRSSSMVTDAACTGGVDVVLNSLTSPGMVAGSLAGVRAGGHFVEISKRDIWSPARLAQERPDLHTSLLAVDFLPPSAVHSALTRAAQAISTGSFCPLPQIMHKLSSSDSALRQMSQARHLGKIVITTSAASQPLHRHTDNCLITGGLGSLGSLTASWLMTQGLQHVTLVGRSGKVASDASTFSNIVSSSWNAAVTCTAADLASSEAASNVLHDGNLPWSSLVHASGVLADAILQNQSAESVRKVFTAKVASLQALDSFSSLQPCWSSVLFSSVAAFLGSAGQGNYSAANGALDGVAAVWAAQVHPLKHSSLQ